MLWIMCMLQLHLTFGPQPIAQIYLSIHAVLAAHEAARGLCLYPIVVAAELLILVRLQAISCAHGCCIFCLLLFVSAVAARRGQLATAASPLT